MTKRTITSKLSALGAAFLISLIWAPAVASALVTTNTSTNVTNTTTTTTTPTTQNNSQATRLNNIILRGNMELTRRLNNLTSLDSLINSSLKLTSSDKTALNDQVSSTIAGLNTLKGQLDSATTVTAAINDVQSIVSEYRVYVFIYPKIHILKVADDQQIIEAKLSALASLLQTRLTQASKTGQNVSSLISQLATINSLISSAQTISSQVETTVVNLQTSTYNSNNSVLSGYNAQLQSARQSIMTAFSDAKTLVQGIESLTTSTTATKPAN